MIQSQQQPINLNANIILLGDTQVGKSTFVDYIENGPRPTNKPAIQMSMGKIQSYSLLNNLIT